MEPHRSLPLSPALGDPGVRRAHYTCPDFLTSGSQERLGPWCEEPGLRLGEDRAPVLLGVKVRTLRESEGSGTPEQRGPW